MELRPILSALLRNKTGPLLVALQVALSLAILANALFIVSERRAVVTRPSGLADEHATFYIEVRNLANATPEQQLASIKRQTAILRAVPGVVGAAHASQMPLSQSGWNTSVAVDRRQTHESATTSMYISGDSLVHALGLKIVDGRDFLPQELVDLNETTTRDLPGQVLITRALAEKLWPGASAVGKTMFFGYGEDAQATQVVGVIDRLEGAHAPVGLAAVHVISVGQQALVHASRQQLGDRGARLRDPLLEASRAARMARGILLPAEERLATRSGD